jgi:hypothetical protein
MRGSLADGAVDASNDAAVVKSAAMTVASWLLVVDKSHQGEVRSALRDLAGVEYRTTVGDHLVLLTESPGDRLAALEAALRGIPSVQNASLVSTFRDEGH